MWGELPMCMHRPLPAGEIRTVSVRREVIAGWPRYSVSIGVMVPDVPCKPDDSRPSVALDIGWRRLDKNRVRVAYWYSSDGAHGEVVMEEKQSRSSSRWTTCARYGTIILTDQGKAGLVCAK